ncbi:hypothetical protein KP005_04085 [Geomonas nitrogeniifigens]|uniref:Lipoprotein n=1 Tax=Geomonas diazotrophica TaxID=2843197 RepID=A0ABX8JLD6_9BACT|nr:hypothetical protein [Geomonas nitrogeniifigens]QWV98474.1 hypothetical protein KP005_04085 [Geomonas nitrogeniifigens]
MKSTPLLISALLHLALGAAIWCYSETKPAVRPPILYVDLATFDATAPPEPPAARIEPPVEPAVVQEDVAETVEAKPEPAQAIAAETAAGEVQPQQAQVAPEISRAFAGAWHAQEMMYNTRRYLQVAGLAMRQVLEGKLAAAERERLAGAKVRITASYDAGAPPDFSVQTDSEELRALLVNDKNAWSRVPSPGECKVQYKKVAFLVSLERGTIQVGLSPQ